VGRSYVNPPEDFRLAPGDDLIVVAESLGTLEPLEMDHDITRRRLASRPHPAITTSLPPFQVTDSVSAAST
jgi:voltage-gated potassium channel